MIGYCAIMAHRDDTPSSDHEAASEPRFTWPPRSGANAARAEPALRPEAAASEPELASAAAVDGAAGRESTSVGADASTEARFDWSGVEHELCSVGAGWPELRPTASWVRAIERFWLGLAAEPFADRAADEGWSPDLLEAFCGRCGRDREGDASESCAHCKGRRLRWDRVVRLGGYEGLLRDAVHEIKFSAWRRLAWDMGRILGRQVQGALRAAAVGSETRIVVVPMPTTIRRRMARGIDHAAAIARGAAFVLEAPVIAAVRRRHRPSQVLVPTSERRANVAGTMRVATGAARRLAGADVLVVVDDVTTTGATAGECCRAIGDALRTLEAGAGQGAGARQRGKPKVWLAVVAGPGGHGEGLGGA